MFVHAVIGFGPSRVRLISADQEIGVFSNMTAKEKQVRVAPVFRRTLSFYRER